MSAAAAILSIVYVTGSVFACCIGCYRSRVLGRRLDSLEEKLEKHKSIPLVYSVPVYSLPPGATAPTAPISIPSVSSPTRAVFEPVSPA